MSKQVLGEALGTIENQLPLTRQFLWKPLSFQETTSGVTSSNLSTPESMSSARLSVPPQDTNFSGCSLSQVDSSQTTGSPRNCCELSVSKIASHRGREIQDLLVWTRKEVPKLVSTSICQDGLLCSSAFRALLNVRYFS